MLVVALLGGESTGKSTLAAELQTALQDRGVSAARVSEHLRTWCADRGRAPTKDEQAHLAEEQGRLIDAAVHSEPPVQVVIADTTPLLIAAYSDIYFQDDSLYPAALDWQRHADLHLLMGLDVPWVPDGLFRDGPALRARTDAVLRHRLHMAKLPFHAVYGLGAARCQGALRIIEQVLHTPWAPNDPVMEKATATWTCERCSDPECERRLFSRLIGTD